MTIMDNLDQIGKEISRAGHDVMNETKKTVDRVKLNAQIANQERKIDALFTELGRKLYEAGGELSHDEYLEATEQLDFEFDLLEQMKEGPVSGADYCPDCGAELHQDDLFCTNCGKPLKRCPNCKKAVRIDSLFCDYCGTKLDN